MGAFDDLDETRRAELARLVFGVLDAWGVEVARQAQLLGFEQGTKVRAVQRLRRSGALPNEGEVLERANCLLIIDRAAHSMYPHSPVAANYWVTTANPYFNDQSPLEVMLASGLAGMRWVVEHLEGSSPWG
jgi:hypothetical protein